MKELKFNGYKILIGPGSIDQIQEIEGKRIFIVTGKASMFKNGTIDHLEKLLNAQHKSYEIYSGIGGNPTSTEVLAGLKKMKAFVPDVVLAVGGGSAIDAAKVMTLLCEYQTVTLDDIKAGKGPSIRKRITLIAAPSTSGTASEVTRAAVITFEEEHIKVGLKTTAFIPDIAILDGNLTLSMPQNVVAETGMDALTHAIEGYINQNNDDFSKVMSKGSVEGLCQYLPLSFEKGDLESRQKVHHYQCLAGMAFQNSGLGMDHGIAHAFGGRFLISHGLLNAVALPYVLKYNARDKKVQADLEELSRMIGEDIIAKVEAFNTQFGMPKTFQAIGILEADFKKYYDCLVDDSLKGSTIKNPISMNQEAMDKVLRSIYYGDILF
ncbi:MAG: iron-containing alcohol dehydrogenase [Eubacterium sp.]